MALHTIEPNRETLHGHFSNELPPVLTVDSGDTVRYRTLDAAWGLEPPTAVGAAREKFAPRDAERDAGHALCGPVAVRGAQPGMTLAVGIDVVQPDTWGWTYAGGWASALNQELGVAEAPEELLIWQLDAAAARGTDQYGHTLALRPFLGVIGMPPAAPGRHPTAPPRTCGGNIDCKELVAGSTLYLPIAVPGALLSAGDGHAVQGDGEVCGQAIECPMARVDLTLTLRDDLVLTTPRAHTPAGWITFGFHEDLHAAMITALDAMLGLLGEQYQLSRKHALALASLAVDLRITQIVNGVRGVHALLPFGAIQQQLRQA